MFCWWQDCPPTLEGPCRDRGPFSPCLNGDDAKKETTSKPKPKPKPSTKSSQTKPTTTTSTTTSTEASSSTSIQSTTTNAPSIISTTKSTPKICVVMGREYKIGDRLPHDTGNCVECVCGAGGQITCSPHQCAPLGDDINDYRPPGPRPPLSDVF